MRRTATLVLTALLTMSSCGTRAGYVVALDRDDYRTSIDAIYASTIDPKLRMDAEKFCADADEVAFENRLDCFWD